MMEQMKSKNLSAIRYGGYSVVVAAIALVVVILLNWGMSLLPASMTKLSTDGQNIYDISAISHTVMKRVKDEVTLYIVGYEDSLDLIITEYTKRYADLSRKVSVKTVDPTLQPGFVSTYTDEALDASATNIIVVNHANKRSRVIHYSDIYYQKYSEYELYYYYMSYGYYPDNPTYFNIENELASAIDYVTMENLPVLYYTSGHGEMTLDETMTGLIRADNIELKELKLSTVEKIPAEASAVLINSPNKDLNEGEIAILKEYAEKGGHILLSSYYNTELENRKLANLYGFAEEYGLAYQDVMVFEGSADHYYTYYGPYYILPTLVSNNYASAVPANTNLVMALCNGIQIAETLPDGVTASALMTTTLQGYAKNEVKADTTTEKAEGDVEGKYTIAAMSTKKYDKGDSKLFWFASPMIMNGSTTGSFSNMNYFLSVLADVCEKEESVSIAAKALQVEALSVSEGSANLWGILLIGVVPVTTLVIGFTTWRRRVKR